MKYLKLFFRLLLGLFMTFAGVSHLTSAFGLDTDQARLIRLFFQPVLIFLALWSTDGWGYCKQCYHDWKHK